VFSGAATAEQTIELFLSSTADSYERVTYDLGPNFRSAQFKSFLERQGSQAWAVPSDAHWPSAAEKSIELLHVELDAVFEECPNVSAKTAFAAAAHRLNDRATWAHNISRRTVHLGRSQNAPRLRQHLFAQAPVWLPPSMSDVEAFLSLWDEKRRAPVVRTGRSRLKAALRQRNTVTLDAR
jgi:hypothetical protein